MLFGAAFPGPGCDGKGHVGRAGESTVSLCFLFAVALETEEKSTPVLGFAGPTDALGAGQSPCQTCGGFACSRQGHLPRVSSTCCLPSVRAASNGHLSFLAEPACPGGQGQFSQAGGVFSTASLAKPLFDIGLDVTLCRETRALLWSQEGAREVVLSLRAFLE